MYTNPGRYAGISRDQPRLRRHRNKKKDWEEFMIDLQIPKKMQIGKLKYMRIEKEDFQQFTLESPVKFTATSDAH